MTKLSSVQQFGENFLKVIENERLRKQQREEFNREMSWRNRQLNLMDKYKTGLLEQGQQQEYRLGEQLKLDALQSGFGLVPEKQPGRENIRTGEYETESRSGTILPTIDIGKNLYTYPEPQAPDLSGDRYETIETNVVGTGEYTGQKVNRYRDKFTNKEYQRPVYIKPEKTTTTTTTGGKDPKLSEAGSKGLAWLKNPIFRRDLPGLIEGKVKSIDLRPEEIANKFSESINALKKDVLGSRATNWFDNIVREFGRIPTADELDRQIVKHATEHKTITDTEVGQLNRLVQYLEDAETGINKIQKR